MDVMISAGKEIQQQPTLSANSCLELRERKINMNEKRSLAIGTDDFRKLRENGSYYVDKSLMIKDFIEMQDEVALITRPRRFGKTLNMTMIREFFDITKDSSEIFQGQAIMDTEYAKLINSRPVIYLTFKDCKGTTANQMFSFLKAELYREYLRQQNNTKEKIIGAYEKEDLYSMTELLRDPQSTYLQFGTALLRLTQIVKEVYQISPILLIDEYDQPIMSSYEFGYHEEVGMFFSNLYGSAMKGNPAVDQALLTGVQRVAKESIFSQFNNPQVYTVVDREYAPYFGLNEAEAGRLLEAYGYGLSDEVRSMYDGYNIGGIEMYNPWSILSYAKKGRLENYWVKTSANFLVKSALETADRNFWNTFDELAAGQDQMVYATLDTSFAERSGLYSLWGLLINAGYLTIASQIDADSYVVRIPNNEVLSEFQTLITEVSGVDRMDLQRMFQCLLSKDMSGFLSIYQNIVISCTSYMDAKENAYHMLFLGMCITLRGAYRVTSNLEAGYGRSDITLQSLSPAHSNVIVEFKQGEDIDRLKEEALQQILDNKYDTDLSGEVICVGLAHDKKRCSIAYKVILA